MSQKIEVALPVDGRYSDPTHTSTYILLYPKMSSLSITEHGPVGAAAPLWTWLAPLVTLVIAVLIALLNAAAANTLHSRSPLEILQEEMTEMKRQMTTASRVSESEALDLRESIMQIDTLYKSSREEIAAANAELVALKSVVCDLIALRYDGSTRRQGGGGNVRAALNAIRGQGLFERLGVPAYFVAPDDNQIHRSVPIDWDKVARAMESSAADVTIADLVIEYPSLV